MKRSTKILFRLPVFLRKLLFTGSKFRCSVCESNVRLFLNDAKRGRFAKRCPVCGSLERHRVIADYLLEEFRLQEREALSILHFAPEPGIKKIFQHDNKHKLVTADYSMPGVDLKIDMCNMEISDNSYDVIYCSHVLEHVNDDRAAMNEAFRILADGGVFLVMVPLHKGPTVEDPEEKDPQRRIERFGQTDHIRMYGMDIVERLESAGFTVSVIRPNEGNLGLKFEKCGYRPEDIIFKAEKLPKSS